MFPVPPVALTIAEFPLVATTSMQDVPFYSQFKDISSPGWQKVGCGIASLAMVVDYFATSSVSVNKMLSEGIALGAYSSKNGWTYAGLISLAAKYRMQGESRILYNTSTENALAKLQSDLKSGPVLASVHYKFDPKNPIPHLVVINRIEQDSVYYNDPAAASGNKKITLAKFLAAWKKRYLVFRPAQESAKPLLSVL